MHLQSKTNYERFLLYQRSQQQEEEKEEDEDEDEEILSPNWIYLKDIDEANKLRSKANKSFQEGDLELALEEVRKTCFVIEYVVR